MIVSLINSMLDTDIKIFRIDNSVGFPKLDEYGFSLFLFWSELSEDVLLDSALMG